MEKLIQLEPNDLPKFQEHLKNVHSAEIQQTEAQTQPKEVSANKEKSNKIYTQNLPHKPLLLTKENLL